MIDPVIEQRLTEKLRRADKIIMWCAIGILFINCLLFGFLIVSVQNAAQKYHHQTQLYVRCIAIALTKPLDDRSELDFDKCTKEADDFIKAHK